MSETIAITGKSVKLFKGHYTRLNEAHPVAALRLMSRGLPALPKIRKASGFRSGSRRLGSISDPSVGPSEWGLISH
ncbi:MAG: hypothetical protein ACREYE_31365 [Gammaproteobacteria bacterium]